MGENWIPGPRYLCRRKLVIELVDGVKPEDILEIGFGSGDLLRELSRRGYRGTGIDQSETARKSARALSDAKLINFRIEESSVEELASAGRRFPLVMAFEVLEHIEKDEDALLRWGTLVQAGGHLLISVPAHMAKWGHNDEYAGHIRRYEKKELTEKLLKAGFEIVNLYSYGYPAINLVKYAKDFLVKRRIKSSASALERTGESWKGLSLDFYGLGRLILNDAVFYPVYLLQKLFLDKDLGTGYLALARKRGT